jgi:acyl carrier protein
MEAALDDFVFDKVVLAIERATRIGDRNVAPETRLVCDLTLGWFGRLKLAIYLEEIFDIELSNEVLEQFATVADIVKCISRNYFQDIASFRLATVG